MTGYHLEARLGRAFFLLLLLGSVTAVQARGVYQEPSDFVAEAFDGKAPPIKRVWLSGDLGETYREVMQESPRQLRLRYWQREERSVWILEAIGKEHPITAGFIVEQGRLQLAKVLAFRESRGWEIRYPFFTDQFRHVGLGEGQQLDSSIDSITGATLSVQAMHNMARMALILAARVDESRDTP